MMKYKKYICREKTPPTQTHSLDSSTSWSTKSIIRLIQVHDEEVQIYV